jgi:hypothetical protein
MFFRINIVLDGLPFALCLASQPGESAHEKRSRHRQRHRREVFPYLDWTMDRSFAGPAPALTPPAANVRQRVPGGSGNVCLDFVFAAGSAANILPIFI